jgi:hypothetical protein
MAHRGSAIRPTACKTYCAHEYALTVTFHPHLLRTGLVPSRYPAIQYTLQPIQGAHVPARTRTAIHWYPTLTSARQVFKALQPHDLQTLFQEGLYQLLENAVAQAAPLERSTKPAQEVPVPLGTAA